MKIKKLQINNYRMLKDLNFDLEDELSLVIGKNNCGKTSLLSALEKFIGSQSASNNFTFDDFNSDLWRKNHHCNSYAKRRFLKSFL